MYIRKLTAVLSVAAIAGAVALPSASAAEAASAPANLAPATAVGNDVLLIEPEMNIGQTSLNGDSGITALAYSSTRANKLFAVGKKYLGRPYEYGSSRSNTKTFDCSDFVKHVYKEALGITLPASSATQASWLKKKGGVKTNWRSLKPGDLMFFMGYKGTSSSSYKGLNKSKQTVQHVGIYMGNGKIMHTYSKASGGVRIDSIAGKHWEYRFLFGGTAM